MTAKERILAIKLMANAKKYPNYVKHLGIESKIKKMKRGKTNDYYLHGNSVRTLLDRI